MNKPFSEIVNDELFDTRHRYSILNDISKELNSLLYENAYLRAENERLEEENKMYRDNIKESIDNSMSTVGTLLHAYLNKED